ncbi:MAG TPA: hypothetical protein EYN51_07260 [Flavobacteriales bacterium]|nr:hypothetical protein [Flavobacteriales bacterium]
MPDYKKLNVWIDSKELVSIVYRITANYPKEEQFGILNQILIQIAIFNSAMVY